VTRSNGQFLRGVMKNEDTFSLQIMDEKEQLHMLLKSDLKQIERPRKSLMPTPKLTSAELEDVVAFLAKRGPDSAPPAEWKPSADLNVTFSRLKNTAAEPQNWLTYWGDYQGTHYSYLNSITPDNVKSLAPRWTFQYGGTGNVESPPIVVDGLMFVTGPLNNATALDARTGRPVWRYTRTLPNFASHCTVAANRGFAILGDRLYMGTLDAHLVSLDAKTGGVIWDVAVEDYQKGFVITHAPLAIDGKIIVGITSGECALTGFLDAMTPPRESGSGAPIQLRKRAIRIAPLGRTTRRLTRAADLPGRPAPMTRRPTPCFGPSAILAPTTMDRFGRARTCTLAASSRSNPIPAR